MCCFGSRISYTLGPLYGGRAAAFLLNLKGNYSPSTAEESASTEVDGTIEDLRASALVHPERLADENSGAEQSKQSTPPSPEEEAAEHAERLAQLEDNLSNEAEDPDWSDSAESQVSYAVAKMGATAPGIKQVHCAASMCRVDLNHASQGNHDEFFAAFPKILNWHTDALVGTEVAPSGEIRTKIYLQRAGGKPGVP